MAGEMGQSEAAAAIDFTRTTVTRVISGLGSRRQFTKYSVSAFVGQATVSLKILDKAVAAAVDDASTDSFTKGPTTDGKVRGHLFRLSFFHYLFAFVGCLHFLCSMRSSSQKQMKGWKRLRMKFATNKRASRGRWPRWDTYLPRP